MPPGLAGLLWERRPRRDHGFRRVMKELGRKLLWRFRIRGVRVSTSSLAVLQAQAKFRLHDEWSNDVPPDEDDCQRAGIVFQQENIAYIDRVLELLRHDTPLDAIVAAAARLRQAPDDFVARDEVDYDLRIRQHQAQQTEAALVGDLIRVIWLPT